MGQAREVMDRLTEAMQSKNLKAIGECYADDAVAHTPDHGEIKGRAEIVQWWSQMIEAFPDGRYESVAKHESGDTAIDEGYFSGTNTGPMTLPTGDQMPPTGKRMRSRGCDAATVENGLIVDYRMYFDQLDFLEQLGMTPGSA